MEENPIIAALQICCIVQNKLQLLLTFVCKAELTTTMKLVLILVVILVTQSLAGESRITTTTPLPGSFGVSNGSPTQDNAGTVSYLFEEQIGS